MKKMAYGLRVVDTSILPDVVRANTNATISMMTERIADWIKGGQDAHRGNP